MRDIYRQYLTNTAINQAKKMNQYFESLIVTRSIYAVVSKRVMVDNVETYEDPIIINNIDDYNVFMASNEGVYIIAMKTYYGIGILGKTPYYQSLGFKKVIADTFRPLFESVILN